MKKLVTILLFTISVSVLLSSCKEDTVCLECTITIAGLEEVQPKFCGEGVEVDDLQSDFQEIVDRENAIVGQSASLDCIKYIPR